jgi:pyruvate-formate lyase-activating enzyme
MRRPNTLPSLLFADHSGKILDLPDLEMAGMSNGGFYRLTPDDIIPLPQGSQLFTLPGRMPIGWDREHDEPVVLEENPFEDGGPIQAVAAFMAPAHTAIYSAAYRDSDEAPPLPLFAYTAVGWHGGRFWVAGFRSDRDKRQDADQYRQEQVEAKTAKKLRQFPHNRLIQHLGKCCLAYGCPAARNYFLDRWEAPLPTSPSCNARCLGCISLQSSGCCRSTQERIAFVPTVDELCEVAVPHLDHAANPIVSFGQGCEGEPLLQAEVIAAAIALMRSRTEKGTINLNSNSSLPDKVALLVSAGLDSLRVSLNSAQEDFYNRYYRPMHYRFADVLRSIDVMKSNGRFVSLNYFILPGFTDSEPEYRALGRLLAQHRPDFLQLRNLNIDPLWYLRQLEVPASLPAAGIRPWLTRLKSDFPWLRLGYFNPQVPRHHASATDVAGQRSPKTRPRRKSGH